MKYQHDILIKLPLKELIEKFDNPDNMKHWQKGFISFEHESGHEGAVGAKSKLKYKMGKREIEMTETIIKRTLPHEFHATYEANGVFNTQENYFEVIDDTTTKWISKSEFKFTNFMMKVMGFLMPGAFKKQSYEYMVDFKNFAEKGISIADA